LKREDRTSLKTVKENFMIDFGAGVTAAVAPPASKQGDELHQSFWNRQPNKRTKPDRAKSAENAETEPPAFSELRRDG
jgi:hypothetical protein